MMFAQICRSTPGRQLGWTGSVDVQAESRLGGPGGVEPTWVQLLVWDESGEDVDGV